MGRGVIASPAKRSSPPLPNYVKCPLPLYIYPVKFPQLFWSSPTLDQVGPHQIHRVPRLDLIAQHQHRVGRKPLATTSNHGATALPNGLPRGGRLLYCSAPAFALGSVCDQLLIRRATALLLPCLHLERFQSRQAYRIWACIAPSLCASTCRGASRFGPFVVGGRGHQSLLLGNQERRACEEYRGRRTTTAVHRRL